LNANHPSQIYEMHKEQKARGMLMYASNHISGDGTV